MSLKIRRQRSAMLIILLAVAAVAAFIAWSLWAELDQITRARGQVIPSGRTQIVQSADGGVIQRIAVREGDTVQKGQVLVTLDKVSLGAAVEEGQARVAALKSAMARIEAELFDKPLSFPPDVQAFGDFARNQTLLYRKRRASLESTIGTLRQQLAYTRRELAMYEPLLRQGDVSETEVLRLRRAATDIEGEIQAQRNQYLTDLQTEYARTQEELVTAEETLTQRQASLGNTELVAPVTGVVKNVRLTTVGGVLRPGDEMLEIVPTGDELIVEARVSPAEIAFIRKGQEASVKFDAFDSGVYGSANGTVIFVSPDTLVDRSSDRAETFYRVQLSVDTGPMHAKDGSAIAIQPGMTATAEIKTGENSVFRYLTKPVTKTLSESMGEP